jgi:hypothetical protein
MNSSPIRRWERETLHVAALAACASLASFLVYFHRGDILLFGDTVAHINIARKILDSRTPGLLQLGTVWLPLPHLLMIPLVVNDWSWRTGLGGSIPSMIAYVFAVAGIFRLVRNNLAASGRLRPVARRSAWLAAIGFGGNPNLLYLQATAMTESLYLALFVWATVYFCEFLRNLDEELRTLRDGRGRFWSFKARSSKPEAFVQESGVGSQESTGSHAGSHSKVAAEASTVESARKSAHPIISASWKCGACLAAACLTRYDGWFVGAAACIVAIVIAIRPRGRQAALVRAVRNLVMLAAAAPVLWLVYNGVVYRNPLEFENGPYSAKAIERKTVPQTPPHPGMGSPAVAALYFLKAAEFNVAEGVGLQGAWLALAFLGVVMMFVRERSLTPLLLLWVPVVFYAFSVAYGGVPIFTPTWWPFSLYNIRYGIQLLPALTVFLCIFLAEIAVSIPERVLQNSILAAAVLLVLASYAEVWSAQPVSYREAWVNSRTRLQLEQRLAVVLKSLPPKATLLMYLGGHVGALQDAGIPLRHVIHEGNHRVWMQPSDPEGLWEQSLADPSAHADYVVAIDRDPVWQAVQNRHLPVVAHIEVEGKPSATIYRARAVKP